MQLRRDNLSWERAYDRYIRALELGQGCWEDLTSISKQEALEKACKWIDESLENLKNNKATPDIIFGDEVKKALSEIIPCYNGEKDIRCLLDDSNMLQIKYLLYCSDKETLRTVLEYIRTEFPDEIVTDNKLADFKQSLEYRLNVSDSLYNLTNKNKDNDTFELEMQDINTPKGKLQHSILPIINKGTRFEFDSTCDCLIVGDSLCFYFLEISRKDLCWRSAHEGYVRAIKIGQGCWERMTTITKQDALEKANKWIDESLENQNQE